MNLCVFSRDLLERYKLRFNKQKVTDNQDEFKQIIVQYFKVCTIEPYIICDPHKDSIKLNQMLLYVYATNNDLRNILAWLTKNILSNITEDTIYTFGVKLRIFTSMLNKLTFNEKLDINTNSIIHFNVVKNLWAFRSDVISSELPFLP